MSDDGLIYATPDFAKPPAPSNGNPTGQASPGGKPATKPKPKTRQMDYTPVEYGELNFANMKKE